VCIAREMITAVRSRVHGVQVAAPMGRVPVVLEVLQGLLHAAPAVSAAAGASRGG
jgi:hypothetical protein